MQTPLGMQNAWTFGLFSWASSTDMCKRAANFDHAATGDLQSPGSIQISVAIVMLYETVSQTGFQHAWLLACICSISAASGRSEGLVTGACCVPSGSDGSDLRPLRTRSVTRATDACA